MNEKQNQTEHPDRNEGESGDTGGEPVGLLCFRHTCSGLISRAVGGIAVLAALAVWLDHLLAAPERSLLAEGVRFFSVGDFVALLHIALGWLLGCGPLLSLHEALHVAAFRLLGVQARLVPKQRSLFLPYPFGTSGLRRDLGGEWTSLPKYRAAILFPTVGVSTLCLLLGWMDPPTKNALLVALIIHLLGCAEDWWIVDAMRGLPADRLVTEIDSFVAVYPV